MALRPRSEYGGRSPLQAQPHRDLRTFGPTTTQSVNTRAVCGPGDFDLPADSPRNRLARPVASSLSNIPSGRARSPACGDQAPCAPSQPQSAPGLTSLVTVVPTDAKTGPGRPLDPPKPTKGGAGCHNKNLRQQTSETTREEKQPIAMWKSASPTLPPPRWCDLRVRLHPTHIECMLVTDHHDAPP